MKNNIPHTLRTELKAELTQNILPYWMNKMKDNRHGGFYGCINGREELIPEAEKGAILNARILWTFSAAYRETKDPAYLSMAGYAKEYIFSHFMDPEHGGTWWSVTYDGKPANTKKQIYSIAFFVYALSEYYRASGNEESLSKAIELFWLIEKYSFDKGKNGYIEAFGRDWKTLDDLRLSAKDANEKKTMNTHLHILEAYTNLYRIWKDEQLKDQLENLITLFLEKIVDNKSYHLGLFFNEDWICKSHIYSYGHDIEASWLLREAAQVSGNHQLVIQTEDICLKIVNAATEGFQDDGSLIYERHTDNDHTDYERHWWLQAEAVVGYCKAFKATQEESYLLKASRCWNYIKENIIDHENGEWFWSVNKDGQINRSEDKAGFWKCPYHNARMCMEAML